MEWKRRWPLVIYANAHRDVKKGVYTKVIYSETLVSVSEDVSVDEKIEETKELYLKEHVTHESIDIRLNDEKNVIQNDVCDKTNISEEDDGLNIPFSNERDSLWK